MNDILGDLRWGPQDKEKSASQDHVGLALLDLCEKKD